jgi:hypothetical protein
MFRKFGMAAVAAGCLLASTPVAASPILTGTWYEFLFGGVGSALTAGTGGVPGTNPDSTFAPDAPWTFTLVDPAELVVTDAFASVDQFELFDGGVSLGSTSAPTSGGACGGDITACLADPSYSHGTFLLTAGDHSITGSTLLSGLGSGAAFFIVRAVPEPGTWMMMLFGFGAIGLMLRRSRKAIAQLA